MGDQDECQDEFEIFTHTVAVRATSMAREKTSFVDAFHGPVVSVLDTHSLDVTTRARCGLRIFRTTDTTLLVIGALVGGF